MGGRIDGVLPVGDLDSTTRLKKKKHRWSSGSTFAKRNRSGVMVLSSVSGSQIVVLPLTG